MENFLMKWILVGIIFSVIMVVFIFSYFGSVVALIFGFIALVFLFISSFIIFIVTAIFKLI